MSDNFCLTVSGRIINFVELDRQQITLEDIANGLAVMPRWAGQTDWERHGFAYVVAQHSYHVAEVVKSLGGSVMEQLAGLHHDDFEGYGCDVPTPLKRLCQGYSATEKRTLATIFEVFGLPAAWAAKLPDVVREADAILLATEARDLCHADMAKYVDTAKALATRLDVWSPPRGSRGRTSGRCGVPARFAASAWPCSRSAPSGEPGSCTTTPSWVTGGVWRERCRCWPEIWRGWVWRYTVDVP